MNPFDPNKTQLGAPSMGQATQAMNPGDLMRTQAVTVAPVAPVASPFAPIEVRLIPGREASMANGPARERFLVELEARSGMAGMVGSLRAPLNLCLVLDRSGSMEGAPLAYAKEACKYVVDLLGPNDVLSIVTFEERVEVLMPPQRVVSKEPIKQGIERIQAGNTTNLYDGMGVALQQVLAHPEPGRVTRMVVLTDGDPTTGIKDFPSLTQHAANIKAQGASITFLGFGPDYNEELLAAMAKRAGGNYAYIPRPEMIPEVFRLELDKLLSTAASQVTLELKTSRWVELVSATGLNQPPSGNQFVIPQADLERGSVMQIVVELDFPNHPLGFYRVAQGALQYEDSQTGTPQRVDLDFIMEFSSDAAKYGAPVDPRVGQAAEISAASRAVEKTMMGLKTGQFTAAQATAELQRTQALLVSQGRTVEAQEVTTAMRALQTGDLGGAQKTLMGAMVHLDQGKSNTSN